MNNPSILTSLGDFTCVLPQELNLGEQDPLAKELANDIKTHYFGNSEPNIDNVDIYIKVKLNLMHVIQLLEYYLNLYFA